MAKALKIVLIIIGLVVILAVAGAVALTLAFDPNDYKDQISSRVEEATGRKLEIQGDIGLTYFPWLGVEVGAMKMANAPGFGEQPFARIDQAQIRVKLLPLFRREVEMDTVTLEGLALHLARDTKGRTNWEDLLAAGAKPEKGEQPAEQEPPALAALAIGGVQLQEARIVWDDRQANNRYTLNQVNLTTGALEPGAPVDVDLDFILLSTSPKLQGPVSFRSTVQVNPFSGSYALRGTRVTTQLKGEGLPGGRLNAELAADIHADLIKQRLKVAGMKLSTLGLQVQSELEGEQILRPAPRLKGSVQVATFSPRDVLEALGTKVQTADADVLAKASMKAQLNGTTRDLNVEGIEAKLDDTTLKGSMNLKGAAKPSVRYELEVDRIDADRYLPPPPAQESEAPKGATPGAAAAAGGEALPLEALRSFNAQGTVRIRELKIYNLRTRDIVLTTNARDGLVRLNPVQAKLYEGEYQGNIQVDARKARGANPRFSLNESLRNVQAGPLLKDLTGKDRITGTANVTLKLNGQGETEKGMRRTLNGATAFTFTDGAIKGVNIAKLIREAYAKYKGLPPPPDAPEQTDFTVLKGTGRIVKGVLRNRDLTAKSPLLRLNGDGKVDLVREKVDYTLSASVVGSLKGQGGEALSELKDVTIPILIKGDLSDPSFGIDMKRLFEERAKEELKEKLMDKLDKPSEKAPEKPGDKETSPVDKLKEQLEGLKGLFK